MINNIIKSMAHELLYNTLKMEKNIVKTITDYIPDKTTHRPITLHQIKIRNGEIILKNPVDRDDYANDIQNGRRILEIVKILEEDFYGKFNIYHDIIINTDTIIIKLKDLPTYVQGNFNIEIDFTMVEMDDKFKTHMHSVNLVKIWNAIEYFD